MHHCIQGWSGIAKWGGIPMKTLIELVRPKPEAKVVAFFSFGEALYGGSYYDTQSLENVLKPQCLLAIADERSAAPADIWSTPAAASGEPAWLQDGQMDRADRVHRIGKDAGQRRRRQKRGRRIFRPAAQHLMRKLDSFAQEHAGADHILSLLRRAPAGLAAASLSAATRAVTLRFCEWLHYHRRACPVGARESQPICVSIARDPPRISCSFLRSPKRPAREIPFLATLSGSSAATRRSLSRVQERCRSGCIQASSGRESWRRLFRSRRQARSWFSSMLAIRPLVPLR